MNSPARELPGVKLSARFDSLWQRCARAENATHDGSVPSRAHSHALYADLAAAYDESQRRYHTLDHIEHCLAQLDGAVAASAVTSDDQADVIEMALWYHDIIYKPQADDNELQSALLFRGLAGDKFSTDFVDAVYRLIMITVHRQTPVAEDERLMVDVDLSSFGMPWEDFYRDSVAVRTEMGHMTDADFAQGQGRFLRSLIERDHIYGTDYFRDLYESRARTNIESYLGYLKD